ncbi:MAG: HNH endonuclease [Candidatus Doudnabacteria bacterium]|nr:HNH endonuclease [Candidatus Doudnabacteria bacterium]
MAKKKLLEELLKIGTKVNPTHLKEKLLREGRIKNQCQICGQLPLWRGKSLCLILDHVNGVRTDNRIENLRLLCPNCGIQQNTFSGRNKGRSVALTKIIQGVVNGVPVKMVVYQAVSDDNGKSFQMDIQFVFDKKYTDKVLNGLKKGTPGLFTLPNELVPVKIKKSIALGNFPVTQVVVD